MKSTKRKRIKSKITSKIQEKADWSKASGKNKHTCRPDCQSGRVLILIDNPAYKPKGIISTVPR